MTTVLRASDSAQFLSIVPSLAGFTPRESLVLLPFTGSRTAGAMRLDLPDDAASIEEYADAAIGLISRVHHTDAVALVIYTGREAQTTPDGLVLPFAVAVDELLGRASDAGLRIVDALCVLSAGWSSYLEEAPEIGACPGTHPGAAGLRDVSGDQWAGTEAPQVDPVDEKRVGRALEDLDEMLAEDSRDGLTGTEHPESIAALMMLEDVPAFFEAVLSAPEALPPFAVAALLWCLDRPLFRDVALTQWATDLAGGVRTLEAQILFARAAVDVPDDIGDLFLGRGPSPDPRRLRDALLAVRRAAAFAPRFARCGPLTAAAWLSWALGRATHASHYLQEARAIDPEYGLAALLETMISAAVLPEWAFRREAPSAT